MTNDEQPSSESDGERDLVNLLIFKNHDNIDNSKQRRLTTGRLLHGGKGELPLMTMVFVHCVFLFHLTLPSLFSLFDSSIREEG